MKKISKLVCCFLFVMCVFAGCTDDPGNSSLTTFSSSQNIWECYYEYLNLEQEFNANLTSKVFEVKDDANVIKTDAQKYTTMLTNSQMYKNIVRDSIAVIDVYEQSEKQVLFQFDQNLSDYRVKEISASGNYEVSYNQKLFRNVYLDGNQMVDNLIYGVPLKNVLRFSVAKSDLGIYTIKTVEQNISLPENISAYEKVSTDSNGNTVTLKLEITQTQISGTRPYTQTVLLASEVVTDSQSQQVSSYQHEVKYYLENNHFYLRDVITSNGVIKSQQKFRLDNTFSNISINYNSAIGYLSYDMGYNLNGNMKVFGEIYYQGSNKFLAKEFVQILNGKPFELTQNFITETNFLNQAINTKTVFNSASFTNIKNQELSQFALYNNESNAVCAVDGEEFSLTFYN